MSTPKSGNPPAWPRVSVAAVVGGKTRVIAPTVTVCPAEWNDPDGRRLAVRLSMARAKLLCVRHHNGFPDSFVVKVNHRPITENPCGLRRIVEALSALPPVRTVNT